MQIAEFGGIQGFSGDGAVAALPGTGLMQRLAEGLRTFASRPGGRDRGRSRDGSRGRAGARAGVQSLRTRAEPVTPAGYRPLPARLAPAPAEALDELAFRARRVGLLAQLLWPLGPDVTAWARIRSSSPSAMDYWRQELRHQAQELLLPEQPGWTATHKLALVATLPADDALALDRAAAGAGLPVATVAAWQTAAQALRGCCQSLEVNQTALYQHLAGLPTSASPVI